MTPLGAADMDWLAALLQEAGTTEIMPRFRNLDEGAVRHKTSADDLVTEADVNAERMITEALLAKFPGSLVIGEEAVSDNPALLDNWTKSDKRAFVVDPIDGTFNFASGVASFGVMLGIVEAGETVAGIIHDPVGQDWIMAQKGAGALLRRHDGRETALMPWDHLAGALITQEAGGYVRRFDGSAYRPEHLDGGLLATSDFANWTMVREALWRA